MASKSSKKRKNRGLQPNLHINKDTYFESGRIKRLPQGIYYIGRSYLSEEKIIYVGVTRTHVNGHISFALFGINDDTGQIINVQYDFNVEKKHFESFLAHTSLEYFEDSSALENLIYMAEIESRQMGYLPPDYWCASKILKEPKETLLQGNYSRLALFQSAEEISEGAGERLDISTKLDKQAPIYSPSEVNNWDKDRWEAFFEKNSPFEIDEKIIDLFSPLVYLFEKTQLPYLTIDPEIADSLDKLRRIDQPFAAYDPGPDFKYDDSEEEIFLGTSFQTALRVGKSKSDHRNTIKKIREAIERFPENLFFRILLYSAYKYCAQLHMACKIAIENYRFRENYMNFVTLYLSEILEHDKSGHLKQFIKKGYLLEDHVGQQTSASCEQFFYFYLGVGGYFASNFQLAEFWELYGILKDYPEFNKGFVFKSWHKMFYYSAVFMIKALQSYSKEDKEDLMAKLMFHQSTH